jgi:hypothetical protein
MTYDEFQRHVGKAGLTLKAFAELVRMNRISLSNLAKKGEVPAHLAIISALLGEMADNGIDYREVLTRIAIVPKKPRGAGRGGKFGGDKQEQLFAENLLPKRTADGGTPGTSGEHP